MHNILSRILKKKEAELQVVKAVRSLEQMKSDAHALGKLNNFKEVFQKIKHPHSAFIAEIKLASPTMPLLGSAEDIVARARIYENAGVDAISVITEKEYFKGDINFISYLKKNIKTPILQKDFVIDPYQIYEAKLIGSDAILLIARLVDRHTLIDFVKISKDIGIEPVVEVSDIEDLEKALSADASFIAVNARDLRTFTIDIPNACTLLESIPDTYIKLAFSGIQSVRDVEKYKKSGANGVLVGTSLMKATDIKSFINNLKQV